MGWARRRWGSRSEPMAMMVATQQNASIHAEWIRRRRFMGILLQAGRLDESDTTTGNKVPGYGSHEPPGSIERPALLRALAVCGAEMRYAAFPAVAAAAARS